MNPNNTTTSGGKINGKYIVFSDNDLYANFGDMEWRKIFPGCWSSFSNSAILGTGNATRPGASKDMDIYVMFVAHNTEYRIVILDESWFDATTCTNVQYLAPSGSESGTESGSGTESQA